VVGGVVGVGTYGDVVTVVVIGVVVVTEVTLVGVDV
jgi:hypothetical protein